MPFNQSLEEVGFQVSRGTARASLGLRGEDGWPMTSAPPLCFSLTSRLHVDEKRRDLGGEFVLWNCDTRRSLAKHCPLLVKLCNTVSVVNASIYPVI